MTVPERQFPVVGIDYVCLREVPEGTLEDAEEENEPNNNGEVAGGGVQTPLVGKHSPNPILCGRNSKDRWLFGYTLQAKVVRILL